jgi:hypothetical protein
MIRLVAMLLVALPFASEVSASWRGDDAYDPAADASLAENPELTIARRWTVQPAMKQAPAFPGDNPELIIARGYAAQPVGGQPMTKPGNPKRAWGVQERAQ